jgi:drug/metabolite transporter (DMT)-like permease
MVTLPVAPDAERGTLGSRLETLLPTVAPLVFVFLWSTGFISAKYGLRDADPLTFLAIRMVVSAAVLALVAACAEVRWPRGRRALPRHRHRGAAAARRVSRWRVRGDRPRDAGGLSSIIIGLQPS